MPVARGLTAAGLIPQHTFDDIERGRGPRDTAGDCLALGQLFRDKKKALQGKHPISDDTVEKAITVGSWLLENLKPAHAPAEKAPPPSAAITIRNRLASLLAKRYGTLEVVAHYFLGAEYESAVPPLNSRKAPSAKANPEGEEEGASGEEESATPA